MSSAMRPGRINAEGLECMRELDAAAADPRMIGADHAHVGVDRHHRAGLCGAVPADVDLPRENQRARLLARFRQAALHEQRIEAGLFRGGHGRHGTSVLSLRSLYNDARLRRRRSILRVMATPPVPTPERWDRVTQLTAEALERPSAERSSWLADACAGDEALHREVESLLVAHAGAGRFLETAAIARDGAAEAVAAVARESLGLAAGRRIGPYRIVRELGHGGMGVVYLAARADLAFEKVSGDQGRPRRLSQ